MRTLCFFIVLLFAASQSSGQMTEDIETDRPDQTETPFLVPRNYFQAEFGLNVEKFGDSYSRIAHPTSLLKYGLSNRFEFRVETTLFTEYLQYIPDTKTNLLLPPIELGTKVRLFEEKGARPKTSLIVHVGLPFLASKEFHSDPPIYSAKLSFQNSLSETIALGYNLGIEADGQEPNAFLYTLAPGFSLGEKWYAYVEVFGAVTSALAEHNLDGGIAYSISNHVKADLSAGFGLGNSVLKHYVALGLSFRVPTSKR